jgi:hypothetical protein
MAERDLRPRHTRRSPCDEASVGAGPSAGFDFESQTIGNTHDVLYAYRPAERQSFRRRLDPFAEGCTKSDVCLDDGEKFQVGVSERDDPIGGAPCGMLPTVDRHEPVASLELSDCAVEVGERKYNMIDVHGR